MDEFEVLDRDKLIIKLRDALPEIRNELNLSCDYFERATGIGAKRITAMEEGRQMPKWNEYLSIVFVLWATEECRSLLDKKGLFPVELKRAFSINRNAHEPTV